MEVGTIISLAVALMGTFGAFCARAPYALYLNAARYCMISRLYRFNKGCVRATSYPLEESRQKRTHQRVEG
ncbi:hypothetical protein EDB83DRAFT_2383220 [Lactarius deliciosus]|nr:hypothetical protein EDB83DRAFT_2383220 [Lactarius deliciosus]